MNQNIKNLLKKTQKKAIFYGETWQNTIDYSEKNIKIWFFAEYEKEEVKNYYIKAWRKNKIVSVKIPKKLNEYVKNKCTVIN